MPAAADVIPLEAISAPALARLLRPYALELMLLPSGEQIPGSYWGEPEAGLLGGAVFARPDTPVHSILHEAAHYVCLTSARRLALWRDAGGDPAEECAVCYLQAVWAEKLPGFSRQRLFADMDAWGYSFREGSAARWFAGDGTNARAWLLAHGLIDRRGRATGRLRRLP